MRWPPVKITGREPLGDAPPPPSVSFESACALGDVWMLTELWKELGFGELRRVFRKTRHTTDSETLIRVLVLNCLCDPASKWGVVRWLETAALSEVDAVVAGLLRPLIDHVLSVVGYDLTTIRSEGLVTVDQDVRKHGMAKEGLIARQFMLGVVQTAECLSPYHEVFDGHASETKTLLPTLTTMLARYPSVRRLILVADRSGRTVGRQVGRAG